MLDKNIFTIGHSTHKIEDFISILDEFSISCVIDVRSSPYSRIAPQFNKPALHLTLREHDIVYMHFEKEFGARQTKPSLLDQDGSVDFDKVRSTDEFKRGIERLKKGLDLHYTIALMCSEANPFDCHRFSLISYQLVKEGIQVDHILQNRRLVNNNELEEWLLKKYHRKLLKQSTFFEEVTEKTKIEDAYRLRGKDVAFNSLKAYKRETTKS